MNLLLLLIAIGLLPLLLGTGLLGLIGREPARGAARLEHGASAWSLGFLVIGVGRWCWAWFALPDSGALQLGLAGALTAIIHGLGRLRRRSAAEASGEPETPDGACHSRAEWLFFAAALALALGSLVDRATLARLDPIQRGDEAAIWTAAARGLSDSGGYTPDYGRAIATRITHPDYPALNPLWQSFVFALEGAPEPFNGRLPMQAAALVLVLLVGGSLAHRTRPAVAAMAVLILAGLHGSANLDLIQTAYSDGLVALGLALATISWLAWNETHRPAELALTTAGLALAVFSKNEGLMHAASFIAVALAGSLLARRRVPLLLLLAFVPFLLTNLVKSRYGLEGDLTGSANAAGVPIWSTIPAQFAERAPLVARYLVEHLLTNPAAGGLLFLAFAVALLAAPRRLLCGPLAAPTLMVLASSAGFALIFIGSVHHLGRGPAAELWHLDTALVRVYGQLLPVLLVLLSPVLTEPKFSCKHFGSNAFIVKAL